MPFADELLEQARHLAHREKKRPRQASLRRAVSTAYYAIFHLLIADAAKNWRRAEQRHALARSFNHGRMKVASQKIGKPQNIPPSSPEDHLRLVATIFIRAQQQRLTADYDNSIPWTRLEALTQIDTVAAAFQSWKIIRKEPIAQAYLFALVVKDR